MGLFDFFKRNVKPEQQQHEQSSATDNKTLLNEIAKKVFTTLKPIGFKKKGRTFNREIEKGIFQVINFQITRDYLHGKFTVNLGVCVDSLYKFTFSGKSKTFYQEPECQIRTRLSSLTKGDDFWWTINGDTDEISKEINKGLASAGLDWFAAVDTKEKIIKNFGEPPYDSSRAKLDVALLVWFDDKVKGAELYNDYLQSLRKYGNPHRGYVEELAKEIGIKLT